MTDIEALQITHEFWAAMADEKCLNKDECSKYDMVKNFINKCSLCELAKVRFAWDCGKCLLLDFWIDNHVDIEDGESICDCENSIYWLWIFGNIDEKVKYARMISEAALSKLKELESETKN